jgi:uncharacterized protein (TIRG00374 family)
MINTLRALLPFGSTGFFLYIAFKDISLADFWLSLKSTSWLLVVVASLMALFSMVLRAWRWRILLRPLKEISFSSVFSFTMIGFMANNILPAHAGEFLKPYLLGKKENVNGVSALATVLLERLLDSFALILLFLVAIFIVPVPDWVKYGGITAGSSTFLSLLLLILLGSGKSAFRDKLLKWIQKLPQKISRRLQEKVETFLEGLTIFRQWKNLLPLVGISLLTWTHMAFTIYLILKLYPMSIPVSANLPMASIVVVVFLAFALVMPSSPGYFGITQIAFKIALGFFAIHEADAVGCSLVFNLTQYVPITIGGLILLLKEGLTFNYLRSKAKHAEA